MLNVALWRLSHQQRSFTQLPSEPVTLAYRLHSANPQPDDDPDISTPLVVMHGVLGNKDNWRSISRQLAEQTGRRVFTLDARNHGDSPHHELHSSSAMLADVVEFMRVQKLNRVCALGHSMGGRCLMQLALQHPQLVERAIIVDISPVNEPTNLQLVEAVFEVLLKLHVPRSKTLAEGKQMYLDELSKLMRNPRAVELILRNLRKRPASGEFFWLANVSAIRNYWSDISNFNDALVKQPYGGPIMFIVGNRIKFFKLSDMHKVRKWFPQAQVELLNEGHLLHPENPKNFLQLVLNFLKEKF